MWRSFGAPEMSEDFEPFEYEEELKAIIGLQNGNPLPTIALLRGTRSLHPEVQSLLAAVLDARGATKWRLVRGRRFAGCPPTDPSHRFPNAVMKRLATELSDEDRELLAAMIDPNGSSEWKLRFELRKGGQRIGMEETTRRALPEVMKIGRFVKSRIDGGEKPPQATRSAANHFRKGLSSIKNAYSIYRAIQEDVCAEEARRAEAERPASMVGRKYIIEDDSPFHGRTVRCVAVIAAGRCPYDGRLYEERIVFEIDGRAAWALSRVSREVAG
jgi:hypothetical protein